MKVFLDRNTFKLGIQSILMAHTTIKVTDEVKKKLVKIAGELKAERGEEVSLNDVIEYLITLYENKRKKPLDMTAFNSLITEMREDSSERVDDVVYG